MSTRRSADGASESQASSTGRPLGVYVIVTFLAFRTLDFLFQPVRAERGGLSSLLLPGDIDPDLSRFISAVSILVLFTIILGLLRLQQWALVLTAVLAGTSLAYYLWLYAEGTPQYLNMMGGVLIALYLNQQEVQLAFGLDLR